MNGLSDLELVAQAMAPTNPVQSVSQTPTSQPQTQSRNVPHSQPPTQTQVQSQQPSGPTTTAPPIQLELESLLPDLSALGIDLSSLTPGELRALQPIIDALAAGSNTNDGAQEGGKEEEDDLKIAELLQQMEAAGLVADDLEGKLDALLENLGETEREIEAALPGRQVGGGAVLPGGPGEAQGAGEKGGDQEHEDKVEEETK